LYRTVIINGHSNLLDGPPQCFSEGKFVRPTLTALRRLYSDAAGNTRGIVLMAAGTFLTTAPLVFIRLLGHDLPTIEIVFLRYLFALIAIVPWILLAGVGATFRTRRLRLHGIRGVITVVSTTAWYYGITVVPLAEALALNCLAAIVVTVGAVLFLGETAGVRRWTAVFIGLAGAWLILRPGLQAVSVNSMIVVFSAFGWGATMLFMKVLSRTDSAITIVVYLYVFNVLLSSVPAVMAWVAPNLTHLLWFAIIGVLSSVGHLAIAQGFKEAEASAIIPADFTRLAWAAGLGFLVFDEVPDIWTIAGASVIFASTTFIAYREAKSKKTGGNVE
jgi:drug/metabolite transporter (DMT)-like permease